MRIVKRAGTVVLIVTCVTLLFVAVTVARTAYVPTRPVGIQQVLAPSSGHQPIPVTILYPTRDAPSWTWTGLWATKLAYNGAIDGSGLPFVIMSHGTGGTSLSHLDTALALAEAGYIVAAPLHAGDNFRDDTMVGKPDWIVSRATQIRQVNDYVVGQWTGRAHIDDNKVGLFGFSAGGTTGLVTIGGTPDLTLIKPQCAAHPEFVCTLLKREGNSQLPKTVDWAHDTRVKAAVIVAPGLGFTLQSAGLANVSIPVQLWDGDRDVQVPLPTNSNAVRDNLPVRPEFHLVAGAGHFSFLPPCGLLAVTLPKMLCSDQSGFDRREPPRVCRRLFGLSYAAMRASSSMA